MTSVRVAMMVMGLAGIGAVAATAWADGATVLQVDSDADVLRMREATWRAWFGGDEAALRRILPSDFVGIPAKAGPLASLDLTIEQSRAFHAAGGRLVRLEFPETRLQRDGDVVILYGRYVAVIETGGNEQTSRGRLTEMFVKRGGRLVHTGWHLDNVAPE